MFPTSPLRSVAIRLALSALMTVPAPALAAPAPKALMQAAERAPDLEARLPVKAVENSAVVGTLTPGLLGAGSIAVTLEDGIRIVAKRQRHVAGPFGSRSWVGEFAGMPGSTMVLTEHKGVVSGFVSYFNATYEIQPARGRAGQHVMFRVDESRLPQPGPSPAVQSGDGDEVAAADSLSSAPAAGGTVVDLMLLYTPRARSLYGQADLEARLLSAVASANQAYLNSKVDLQLNVVHLGEVSYVESGDMTRSLSDLQGASDGQMDGIHRLRDDRGADLVMLVTEDANYCGYANTMRNVGPGFAAWAFSIVKTSCLTNHSLVHELGHNMGAQHNIENASGGGAYSYSYGFRRCVSDGTGFRTVMAYSCSGAARVNYFSNPDVAYNGYATGSPSATENARTLANTMATVAAFRSAGGTSSTVPTTTAPTAPSNMSARAASDQRIDLTWADNSGDESGFRIERSPDGVTWSEIAQVGANVKTYADTGLAASTWYHYRVRAWNSAGTSAYSNVASASTQAPALPPPPAPAPPGGVSATTIDTTVVVSWVDQSSNEAGFEVLRETYNARKGTWGSPTVLKVAIPDVTSLTDSPGSGTYRYSVRTYNAGGSSPWAGPAGATVSGGSRGGGRKTR